MLNSDQKRLYWYIDAYFRLGYRKERLEEPYRDINSKRSLIGSRNKVGERGLGGEEID